MYRLLYDRRIPKDLRKISKPILATVLKKIELLAEQPRRPGVEKLEGSPGYKFRVGDYRVLFLIEDTERTITIYRIKHRKEVYR